MKVNEIFYSIQGEGFHAGEAAVFIRFAGCNLSCPFCDTNHHPFKEMTEDEICAEVEKYPSRLVVITGGEPTLQLTASLVGKLHRLHRDVAIETNGTREIPNGVDWVTVSPKDDFVANGNPVVKRADEVKSCSMAQTSRQKIFAPCIITYSLATRAMLKGIRKYSPNVLNL